MAAERQRQQLTPSLRGVLVETATTGVQRYPFSLLRPLLHCLLNDLLAEYGRQPEMGEDEVRRLLPCCRWPRARGV